MQEKVIFGTRFSGKMKFILENLKISRPGNNLNILLLQLIAYHEIMAWTSISGNPSRLLLQGRESIR